MALDEFFSWQGQKQERRDELNRRAAPAPRPRESVRLAPAEEIQVTEFDGASTTVIAKIRDALARRLRGER